LIMDGKEAALMAERFGWYAYVSHDVIYKRKGIAMTYVLEVGGEFQHHLTDAGMARVLIEGWLSIDPNVRRAFVHQVTKQSIPARILDWDVGYLAHHGCWEYVSNEDPHKAVELAALAQIRGEHE